MPSALRRGMVAGNWKMNGSLTSNEALLRELLALCEDTNCEGAEAEVAVCPPSVYVSHVVQLVANSKIAVGGQNCSEHESGAYTGDDSAAMLKELGCDRVILGHSERRQYHGESSELVAEKCKAAQREGLIPIVCVGETLDQREQGRAQAVVAEQLQAVAALLGVDDVVAYEPVWAIGTGHTATPEQAQEMHAFIRGFLRDTMGEAADKIRLLYGGSVKAANAVELFSQDDIDGGLVGGAALDAQEFAAIVKAAG